MKRIVAVTVAAAALLVPAPARAEETTVGFNDGQRGFINVTLTPDTAERAAADDLYAVNAECHYDLVLGSSETGTMVVAVAGRVVSGPRMIRGVHLLPVAPVGTVATCTLRSAASGAELHTTSRSAIGPVAALAETVEIPVDSIRICVQAYGLFTDGRYVTLDEHCRDAA